MLHHIAASTARLAFGLSHGFLFALIFTIDIVVLLFFFALPMEAQAAEQARVLLESAPDEALTRMQELQQSRADLAAERKRVVRELKNEAQKRKRLMQKARNLSTEDLLHVVVGRAAQAKAKAVGKAKAAAKAAA